MWIGVIFDKSWLRGGIGKIIYGVEFCMEFAYRKKLCVILNGRDMCADFAQLK